MRAARRIAIQGVKAKIAYLILNNMNIASNVQFSLLHPVPGHTTHYLVRIDQSAK